MQPVKYIYNCAKQELQGEMLITFHTTEVRKWRWYPSLCI